MYRRVLLLVLVATATVALLAGCGTTLVRSSTPGPDWSRGVQVGESSLNEAVAMCADPSGDHVHLAWERITEDGDAIEYVQLGASGMVEHRVDLPFAVRSPRHVSLVPDGEDGLIICYLSGVTESRRIYAAHLGPTGEVLAEPAVVAGEEAAPDEYCAVPGPDGVDLFWSNNALGTASLYHARLDGSGRLVEPSVPIFSAGVSPYAQRARDGTLHLAWIHEPSYNEEHVYYAVFDASRRELVSPVELASFALNPKSSRFGPVLALSDDAVHVIWSWEHLAGTLTSSAGEGECHYVSFPMGEAAQARPRTLTLPWSLRPEYAPAQGDFAYTRLASTGGSASELVYMPSVADGQHGEAALALAYAIATRTSGRVQAAVVYLASDGVKGFQVGGRSARNIARPALAADGQGQLHLAWLELAGFRSYRVFYASTSEAARTALSRFGRDDLMSAIGTAAWSVVQAVGMFPVAFAWLGLPLVWIVGYYLVKVEGDLARRGPRIALGVAIAIYFLCKFFVLPIDFVYAAPYADRLPAGLADVYLVALPLAIFLVGLLALRLFLRKSESRTMLFGYMVFGLTDALLTFLVYAPGVLGE